MIALKWWRRLPSRGALVVPVFCVGLVALMWVGFFQQIAFERDRAIAQREEAHDNLARLFEEHVLSVLTSASITLREVESEYRRQGTRLDLAKYFRDRPELRHYRNISLVDRNGDMVLNSVPFTQFQSVRQSENFQYHVNNASLDLYVAKPRLGVATRQWSIVVTRRMNEPDGSFGGTASVGIDPAYFSRFYDEIALGPDSVVTLVGTDGIARARRSNESQESGQDLRQSPLFTTHLPARAVGNGIWTGMLEGVTRLYSYRSVRGFPLVVVVGSSRDVTLAGADQRQRVYGWWISAISVLILGFAILVTLQRIRRERYEQALKESDTRFRTLVEQAGDGFELIDKQGRFIDVNNASCVQLGYSRQELLQLTVYDIVPELSREKFEGNFESPAHRLPETFESVHRRKNGTMFPVEVTRSFVNVGGRRQTLTLVRDITERKRIEQALREHDSRYRAVVETSTDGFAVLDRAGRIVDINDAYVRRSGYSRDELLHMRVADLEAKEKPEETAAHIEAVIRRGSGLFETLHRAKDGSLWPVEVNVTYRSDGGGQILAFLRDITQRKRVESAIKESEIKYRLLFETANDGIFLLNASGFLDCNQKGAAMYGLSKEQIIGRSPDDFSPERQPDGRMSSEVAAEQMQAAFNGEMPIFEWQSLRADGVCFDVELTLSRIEIGGLACLQAIVREITDRKRMEESRLRTQKLESLGTLAGGIAHDFNNILLAINGNATLALEDLAENHPARQSVAEIAKAGSRASDLVRRILAFSRPQRETRSVVPLRPVLEEAVRLLRATLPATIEFRHRCGADAPLVAADTTQVHEAVVNLATNAAHAIGDQPGVIEFVLEPLDVNAGFAARVAGLRPGRYARLSVRDNGCGMSEVTAGRIFDAFFTTKAVGQGTGLGLSIVHGVMTGHGGAIGVESAPGQGSTFHLYFPAAEAQVEDQPREQTRQPTRAGGRHVLYIDDEEALVLLLGRVLERAGHHVTSFMDPKEALGIFRQRPQDYDVVVTDLSMPGMTGFDVAREVLSIRGDIPVLMTTGFVRPEDEERARAVGIRQVILKPNTVNEMAIALDRLLQNG